jgi:excisionase family DNA binding protein
VEPSRDADPYLLLADAVAGVVRQIVKESVAEAVAEVVPQVLAQATGDPVVLMDVPEAAARLRLSESKTKRLIAAGEIATISIGRRRLVPEASLEDYLRRLEGEQQRLPGIDPAG